MVSVACPTVGGPFLSTAHLSHLRSQPRWRGLARSKHKPSVVTSQSLGQKANVPCDADPCPGPVVTQWQMCCCQGVWDIGELEKMEGFIIFKSFYQSQILCGRGLGAGNKMGSPQCLPRQTSKSSDLQAVCGAAVSTWHWKSSGQHYANLLYSIFQYFSRNLHYYCSISHVHCLFVSKAINT